MKLLPLLLSPALLLTACDSGSGGGPTAFDKLLGATPTPTPTPPPTSANATPKPKSGSWMFDKDRGNPLDQKPKKGGH